MKFSRRNQRGSVLIEAAVAIVMVIGASYVSTQTVLSSIALNRWAAAQAIAESAIDIEAARARQIYPSEFYVQFPPNPSVRTVTKAMGTVGTKTLNGTFRYTSSIQGLAPNNARRTHFIIVLEFSVNKITYLKTREVTRYEGI